MREMWVTKADERFPAGCTAVMWSPKKLCHHCQHQVPVQHQFVDWVPLASRLALVTNPTLGYLVETQPRYSKMPVCFTPWPVQPGLARPSVHLCTDVLEAWEDRAVLGDSQKATLNAGNTKNPSWQPCDVSVKNVSAQRYMGEGILSQFRCSKV